MVHFRRDLLAVRRAAALLQAVELDFDLVSGIDELRERVVLELDFRHPLPPFSLCHPSPSATHPLSPSLCHPPTAILPLLPSLHTPIDTNS